MPCMALGPRSSNLRLRKDFTQADKDDFLYGAFEFMDKFFQGSLEELGARNEGITVRHRRVDGNGFTRTIYKDGAKVAGCTIRVGGSWGATITFLGNDSGQTNTHNESLSVGNDDQKLYLSPMGMPFGGLREDSHLSEEGAAEYYWSLLIEPLQERN